MKLTIIYTCRLIQISLTRQGSGFTQRTLHANSSVTIESSHLSAIPSFV